MQDNSESRRKFIYKISAGLGSMVFASQGLISFASCNHTNISGKTKDSGMKNKEGKLGIALVGLGSYSGGQLGPALLETEHCYLAGIVTGTPEKAKKWKSQYDIPENNIYNYDNFDSIKDNKDIDIIYVVLPNSMHAEYVKRAANAGKHVICEKPMAVTVEECDQMIEACKNAGKMLSIGYRLHFEPHNIEMMRMGKEKTFGKVNTLYAEHGMSDSSGWRIDKKLAGGGPLMDVGIYCVQGVRYVTGLEPISVTAQQQPKKNAEKYKEVEETLHWQFEFPGGIIAECKTSYTQSMNRLRAEGEKGWFEISPAYSYGGIKGRTSQNKMNFESVNQQARQMDDFAQAIKNKRPTPVPGEMGRQDVKILQAIYKAMNSGQKVEIG